MKTCKGKDCNNIHHGKGYCSKHLHQMKRHGKILERTRRDINEITCESNICKIVLYDKYNNKKSIAIFDKKYLNITKQYKWCESGGYVQAHIHKNNNLTPLHHFILPPKNNFDIDHINHNGLDNRKCNLRYATRSQNSMNRKKVKGYWKIKGKWVASIKVNYKQINLGRFSNEKDAINARKKAELKYFGEFAPKS